MSCWCTLCTYTKPRAKLPIKPNFKLQCDNNWRQENNC